MEVFLEAFVTAFTLIFSLDHSLLEIVGLSLKISVTSLIISSIIGFPVGVILAITRFSGRSILISIFNSMMGIPPVVVGLIVYLLVSRSGPLGWLEILYTPYAMILAQVFLILPIIISLSTQIFEELHREYKDFFTIFSVPPNKSVITYITDSKDSLITIFLAGFGRAISEVGAVIIVGGNIDHVTRVMTTTIALETSKGNLPFALALGIILLFISLIINIIATKMKLKISKEING
ncbi:MAG: ABC transporter permease [Paracoccaceae bacterium]